MIVYVSKSGLKIYLGCLGYARVFVLGMANGVHTKHTEEGANLTITEPGEIVRIYFGLS